MVCSLGQNNIRVLLFEKEGLNVFVNSSCCLDILNEMQRGDLRCRQIPLSSIWFKQGGVSSHVTTETENLLKENFLNRWLSADTVLLWLLSCPLTSELKRGVFLVHVPKKVKYARWFFTTTESQAMRREANLPCMAFLVERNCEFAKRVVEWKKRRSNYLLGILYCPVLVVL